MDIEQQINDYNTNYFEYVLYEDLILDNNDNIIYKTLLTKPHFVDTKMKFYNIYKNQKKQLQYFVKKYKVYHDNNIEYTIFDDKERNITIYGKELKGHMNDVIFNKSKKQKEQSHITFDNKLFNMPFYISNYNKKNLTHSLFNWNDKINNSYEVNRMTFLYKDIKGHHKLYINFDTYKYDNDPEEYYSVYVNFNYNKIGDFNKKYELFQELQSSLDNI